MKYYINGEEVTREQAQEQKKLNDEIMNTENLEEWLEAMKQARFIVEI